MSEAASSGAAAVVRAAVVGAGSWGTALAMQLARNGHDVRLWDHDAERAVRMQAERQNRRYLPDQRFAQSLRVTGDLAGALDGASLVVSAVPSQAVRSVVGIVGAHMHAGQVICGASKGIEVGTLLTMDEVMREVLPPSARATLCALGGPSFAKEVAMGLPTAVVVAGESEAACHHVGDAFHGGFFRVYHTDDVVGVEIGAALKNVLAIACGVSDGAGLGTNARAALITRGLAEMTRLAVARGAQPLTMMGLAGLGDLVLTCTGDLSRNRRVGLGLGQGKTLPAILEELGQVAEGVTTARSAWNLAQKTGVDVPIMEQVYRMLYEDKPVFEALRDLSGRPRVAER
ncbi:MAG: NAD(P)-dependent glycerol-3-phosphate dehydrogenase [Myxococcales bacterium]|nr:NAD(P)-dependent glycerol-3-phosphate dehydrogenase [Myxococcales bacterium]